MNKQVYDIDYSERNLADIYALDVGDRFRYGDDLVEVCIHEPRELPCTDCALAFLCSVGSGCPEGRWYKTIHEGYFACEEPAAEEETTSTSSAVDELKKQTLFDRITESPEMLSWSLCGAVRIGCFTGYYSMITGNYYPDMEKAYNATLARLKEVEK